MSTGFGGGIVVHDLLLVMSDGGVGARAATALFLETLDALLER